MIAPFDLDELTRLEQVATAGPWHVRHLDDDFAMNAIGIAVDPDTGEHEDMATANDPGPELLAATLIPSPPYVLAEDQHWQENADLIVAARNALPELLRLARLGAARDER